MHMKKVLSVLLSTFMAASFLLNAPPVFAEEEPVVENEQTEETNSENGLEVQNDSNEEENETQYVAQVGDKQYESLQSAIDNNPNGFITLIDNVNEDITIQSNQDIILVLNGFTLTNIKNCEYPSDNPRHFPSL